MVDLFQAAPDQGYCFGDGATRSARAIPDPFPSIIINASQTPSAGTGHSMRPIELGASGSSLSGNTLFHLSACLYCSTPWMGKGRGGQSGRETGGTLGWSTGDVSHSPVQRAKGAALRPVPPQTIKQPLMHAACTHSLQRRPSLAGKDTQRFTGMHLLWRDTRGCSRVQGTQPVESQL